MNSSEWYAALIKPSWAPQSWLFGPVWSVLYLGIAFTFSTVLVLVVQKKIPVIVGLPFLLNLIFNTAFTPLQFTLKNNFLALLDILLVVITLVWAIISIWQYRPWIGYAQIPYLVWVCFASCLQASIWWLNRG